MATKTTAAKTTTRAKKSRAEVQEEFENINEELFAEKEASNQKITEMERLKDASIKDSVKDVTVDGVVQKISTLSVDVGRSLSNLSEKLVQETRLLETLREAVDIEKKGSSPDRVGDLRHFYSS